LRAGDARGALDEFWACLASGNAAGDPGATIEGFAAALRAVGDADAARLYAREAATTPALGPEAAAGARLASADLLLDSAPDEALGIITDMRRAALPEPYAGEAALLVGEYAA